MIPTRDRGIATLAWFLDPRESATDAGLAGGGGTFLLFSASDFVGIPIEGARPSAGKSLCGSSSIIIIAVRGSRVVQDGG
jgi:hypothetical protein